MGLLYFAILYVIASQAVCKYRTGSGLCGVFMNPTNPRIELGARKKGVRLFSNHIFIDLFVINCNGVLIITKHCNM